MSALLYNPTFPLWRKHDLCMLARQIACDRLVAYPPRMLLSLRLKKLIVWIIFNVQSNCQCASQLFQLCQ